MCLLLHSNQGFFRFIMRVAVTKPLYNWNCPDIPRNTSCTMPRRFVINGRPVLAYAESWNFDGNPTETLKTMDHLSNVHTNGVCTRPTWASDLFQIYQRVFDDVLRRFPHDAYFIFVEDDVSLQNATLLRAATCQAIEARWDFYAYDLTVQQRGRCTYEYGTTAFLASATFLRRLRDAPKSTVCSTPIDMYIASIGPWYAAVSRIVKHSGTRLVPPSNKQTNKLM